MKKRLLCTLLCLCMVTMVLNPLTAFAAHNRHADRKEQWYYIQCMGNYLNIDADGNAELRDKTNTKEGNAKFLLHIFNDDWSLMTEDGKFLGYENSKQDGTRIKAVEANSKNYSYHWDMYSENSNDLWSFRPKDINKFMNASGQKNEDGTPIILWTHIDKGLCAHYPYPDSPDHGDFRLIPTSDPKAGTPKQPKDGWYKLRIYDFYNYLSVGKSGKAEINDPEEGTCEFYVERKGKKQITLRLTNGKYLGLDSNIKDGTQLKAVKDPYLWNIYDEEVTGLDNTNTYMNRPRDVYSLRPSNNTKMVVNVSDGKKDKGTSITLTTLASMDSPINAEIIFDRMTRELPPVSWNAPVYLTDTEVTVYVYDQHEIGLLGNKGKIKWSSSNKSVATVDDGIVEAIKAGKTTITASFDGKKLTCKVTVKDWKEKYKD